MRKCDLSEIEILEQAANGDSEALAQLFFGAYDRLEALLAADLPSRIRGKIDPADIIQQTFSEAFRRLSSFEYRDEGSFFAWVKTIAKHRLTDAIRKYDRDGADLHANNSSTLDDPIANLKPQTVTPSRSAARRETSVALRAAIENLESPRAREILSLKYFDGLEWEEIITRLGGTKDAARAACHRALKELKERLGSYSRYLSR